MISWLQSIVLGLLQGVTELFPISSLGHSVVIPQLAGWHLPESSSGENFYLAFLVALHVGTALALFIYFFAEWRRILAALWRSARRRRLTPGDDDERLAWLLVAATIPAGLLGLALEHPLRTLFSHPVPASAFLLVNGLILLAGERLRRRAASAAVVEVGPAPDGRVRLPMAGGALDEIPADWAADSQLASRRRPEARLSTLGFREAVVIGVAQTAALLPGISRSGITMVAGLGRGLSHVDAARFSFLLATPIIAAAGLLKVPLLLGAQGDGIRGQAIVGGVCAGVAAYLSTRFLMRWFQTNKLWPFGVYCVVLGTGLLVYFAA